MKFNRPLSLVLTIALAVLAVSCTSAEGASSIEQPPIFDEPTAAPAVVVDEPTTVTQDEDPPAVADVELIDAALTQLVNVDLATAVQGQGNVLDAGILTDETQLNGDMVTVVTCTWRSRSIRPNRNTYRYQVDDALSATLVDVRTNGPACMNRAMLDSAAEFALASSEHWMNYLGDGGDVDDPALDDFWLGAKVEGLREGRQRAADGFRSIRYSPEGPGTAVAWAHHTSPIELIIAFRYDYDDRYGTYDTRTDFHIVDRTPQRVDDEFVGDDHVFSVGLWWQNETWTTVAFADMYAIDCDEPNCVLTLNALGPHPNRPVNPSIDFAGLTYNALEQP